MGSEGETSSYLGWLQLLWERKLRTHALDGRHGNPCLTSTMLTTTATTTTSTTATAATLDPRFLGVLRRLECVVSPTLTTKLGAKFDISIFDGAGPTAACRYLAQRQGLILHLFAQLAVSFEQRPRFAKDATREVPRLGLRWRGMKFGMWSCHGASESNLP